MSEWLSQLELVQQVIQEELAYVTDDSNRRSAEDLADDVCDVLQVEQGSGRVDPSDRSTIVVFVAERGTSDLLVKVHHHESGDDDNHDAVLNKAVRGLLQELPVLPTVQPWLQVITVDPQRGANRLEEETVNTLLETVLPQIDWANASGTKLSLMEDSNSNLDCTNNNNIEESEEATDNNNNNNSREELQVLLQELEPSQLENLSRMLDEYKGRESQLLSFYRTKQAVALEPDIESLVNYIDPSCNVQDMLHQFNGREKELYKALQQMSQEQAEQQKQYQQQVRQLVQQVDPTLLDQVTEILQQFQGRETELITALQAMNSIHDSERYREKVRELITLVAPDQLCKIDELLQAYRGREWELLEQLNERAAISRNENRIKVRALLNLIGFTDMDRVDDIMEQHYGREQELVDSLRKLAKDLAKSSARQETVTDDEGSGDGIVMYVTDDDEDDEEEEDVDEVDEVEVEEEEEEEEVIVDEALPQSNQEQQQQQQEEDDVEEEEEILEDDNDQEQVLVENLPPAADLEAQARALIAQIYPDDDTVDANAMIRRFSKGRMEELVQNLRDMLQCENNARDQNVDRTDMLLSEETFIEIVEDDASEYTLESVEDNTKKLDVIREQDESSTNVDTSSERRD